MKERFLPILLCLCMVATLIPTVAFAAETGVAAIQLGTGGISDPTKTSTAEGDYYTPKSYIYYGQNDGTEPIKWRVLDADTNSIGTDGMFLLSEYLLASRVYFDNTDPYSDAWVDSSAQAWCKDLAGVDGAETKVINAFTACELAAIKETTKQENFTNDKINLYGYDWRESTLDRDKVFFLSAAELAAYVANFNYAPELDGTDTGEIHGIWWLRSPHHLHKGYVGSVTNNHVFYYNISPSLGGANGAYSARPAFNLNLDAVLLTSAANGGKSSDTVGATALKSVADDAAVTVWKLTLKDSSRSGFSAALNNSSSSTVEAGGSVSINYSGAATGTNEYITAMIVNESDEVLYYGNIANNSASGTAQKITIPAELSSGSYKLKIFNEQLNGDNKTNYASEFKDIAITVNNPAPTLTRGAVSRTSDTTATVKFTSNEAGQYYYGIVEEGSTAPTIATAGTGITCDTSEQTISLTSLTARAKDIYIVVKDTAGNVSSNIFKINIPDYAPISLLTVNLNGGSGDTVDGSYAKGDVVTINAGTKSGCRFAGWTSTNGGTFANANRARTAFIMPGNDTTIIAKWLDTANISDGVVHYTLGELPASASTLIIAQFDTSGKMKDVWMRTVIGTGDSKPFKIGDGDFFKLFVLDTGFAPVQEIGTIQP